MESGDMTILFVIAALAVIALVIFLVSNSSSASHQTHQQRQQSRPPRSTPVRSPAVRTPATPSALASQSGSGIEALLGLLLLGAASVALYKFIQSGGLNRLLDRIGELPIEVEGRTTTIAAAINDEDIKRLFFEAIEKKLNGDQGAWAATATGPIIDVDSEPVASDIADMLRHAVEKRMRDRGI